MCVCVCLGQYVFRVDCQFDDVDIVFTENETNAVMRSHVVNTLRSVKPASSDKDCSTDEPLVSASESSAVCSNSSTSHTDATAAAAAAAAADDDDDNVADAGRCMSDAELSWLLSNDDNSSTDSHSYTKDAFHRYIIAGLLLPSLSVHFFC